jgi:hypothetical protein
MLLCQSSTDTLCNVTAGGSVVLNTFGCYNDRLGVPLVSVRFHSEVLEERKKAASISWIVTLK